jgi:hypothetical protein
MKVKIYSTERDARRAFNFHVARTKGNPVVNPVSRTCVSGDRSIRFDHLATEADLVRFRGLSPTSVEFDDTVDGELAGKLMSLIGRRRGDKG